VFLDTGNIFEQYADIKQFSLKAGAGAGLAFLTPFGPIRFDYGFKLFPKKNEKAGNFHIGISFAF
jgi:outer membrane protein insertion porin family